MWQFVKYSLATVFGLFLFVIVSLLLLAGVGAAMGSADEVYDLKDNSVLRLDLNRPIVENASTEENPFAALTDIYFAPPENLGLIQVLSALERAKVDPKIKGIYLDASFPIAGYAQLSEIREAIQKFQKSGKFVYAYANSYTEKGYYVSSVADKTYLNPNGLLDFNGISVQYTFYKKALDKLEIEPLVFRVGTYKSAVEPFIREDMSEENKAQTSSFLQSINTYIFDKIARSKNIPVRKLDQIADSLQAFEPSNAEKLGMVKQGYWDEFEALLKKASGEKEKVIYVSVNNYLKAKNPIDEVEGKDRIAVLVAEGEISGTRASEGNIGSDDFVKELKRLRESKSVKAIVLRIDSPGGSSLASDIMWREIELTKKVKPIISSMSNYAASGGYYIATPASYIFAEPSTITGSIGVFGMIPYTGKMLENKLGLTFDRVATNKFSVMSMNRKMTKDEFAIVQEEVDTIYGTFLNRVAAGRKMKLEKVNQIARGRVWTGKDAKEIGLVDELGGLKNAIAYAAKQAGIKEPKVLYYPLRKEDKWLDLFEQFEEENNASVKSPSIKLPVELLNYYNQLKALENKMGIQARLPFDISFK